MPRERFNDKDKQQLSAWFQRRYEAQFAAGHAVSTDLNTGVLRGSWSMSSVAYTNPQCLDMSHNGLHLWNNNSADFGYDSLVPYVDLNGTTAYLSRADGGAANAFDIRGNEAYVVNAQRGLTVEAWVRFDDAVPAAAEVVVGKNDAGGLAYWLIRRANGLIRFSVDGGAGVINVDSVNAVGAGVWTRIAGRFIPSTSISVWINGTREADTVAAIPATIQDVTASFTVGSDGVPSLYVDGKISQVNLWVAQLNNTIMLSRFEQKKAMYGVR